MDSQSPWVPFLFSLRSVPSLVRHRRDGKGLFPGGHSGMPLRVPWWEETEAMKAILLGSGAFQFTFVKATTEGKLAFAIGLVVAGFALWYWVLRKK